jgi:uncharacterized protein
VRLLAFSDLHCDLEQAARLVEASSDADVLLGVGDFAKVHQGLEETIRALSAADCTAVLVPGNNETDDALRDACSDWSAATVLHGGGMELEGQSFYGLGAGVPVTPWDWSFDLTEEEAEARLAGLAEGSVLAVHSPPQGHVDESGGRHLGSEAVLRAIEAKRPRLVVCGHIHDAWGQESRIGETAVVNLGPEGRVFDL